jgi:acetyltransferase-like isoleucine patch superfamily enzyme
MIASTAIIHPGVKLGSFVTIEDFCIIGVALSDGSTPETVIGDHAVIRSHTVIYAGNRIGDHFQTGNKANIRECNTIGNNVSIGTLTVIEHHVTIGNDVRIHSQAFIPEFSELQQGAWVGPNVVFTNARYPRSPSVKNDLAGPVLEPNAKIGANVTLLPGVRIGRNSLIGAGSVVTGPIPANVIAAGNPARILRPIDY